MQWHYEDRTDPVATGGLRSCSVVRRQTVDDAIISDLQRHGGLGDPHTWVVNKCEECVSDRKMIFVVSKNNDVQHTCVSHSAASAPTSWACSWIEDRTSTANSYERTRLYIRADVPLHKPTFFRHLHERGNPGNSRDWVVKQCGTCLDEGTALIVVSDAADAKPTCRVHDLTCTASIPSRPAPTFVEDRTSTKPSPGTITHTYGENDGTELGRITGLLRASGNQGDSMCWICCVCEPCGISGKHLLVVSDSNDARTTCTAHDNPAPNYYWTQ
jgi:hypothetical protein